MRWMYFKWKWNTSYGDIFSCSDIIINDEDVLMEEAVLMGNVYILMASLGKFCEDNNNTSSKAWLWILLLLIILWALGYQVLNIVIKFYVYGWTTRNN